MEKKTEHYKDHAKSFDYFFIIGLPNEKITGNNTFFELSNDSPKILSMFPDDKSDIDENKEDEEENKDMQSENKKKENSLNIRNLIESNEVIQIIFPIKSDYLEKINFDDLDEVQIQKGTYVDYLIKAETRPDPFYHCFSQLFFINENFYLHLHFGVFLFYEEIKVKQESFYFEEKNNLRSTIMKPKQKQEKIFAAKAMVIASYQPFYILFKNILEELYKLYLESVEQPLELSIIQLYIQLFHNQNKTLKVNLMNKSYFIFPKMFLPVYDLNLYAFFSNFTFNSFLIMAEHFLKRWPIIMFSKNPNVLYPAYLTIMNLIYPLNITNINDFYKYLTPDIFQKVIPTAMATFVCINSEIIRDEDIKKIVKYRSSTTLIIDMDNNIIRIFKYDNDGSISIHMGDEYYNQSIIRYIWDKHAKDNIILEVLENFIVQLRISEDLPNNYFYYINPETDTKGFNLINVIRKNFFSLFSKFLSFNVPYIEFNVKPKKNQEISKFYIEIDFSHKFEDLFIQNFFSDFKSTPSFNIVYKNKCNPKDTNLKNLILLEELIKIIKQDDKRLFFDECLSLNEESLVTAEKIELNANNIFLNIGKDVALHIYNVLSLRSKNYPGFLFSELGNDSYFLQYTHLNLFFENFNYIFRESREFKDLNQIISNNTNSREDINILFSEIEVFIELVKTGTFFTSNLKLILIATYVTLQSIEFFSIHNKEQKLKKFKMIYYLFIETNGFENKFSFLISIIYKMICSEAALRNQSELTFLNALQEFKIIPSFYVYINSNNESFQDKKNSSFISHKKRIKEELLTGKNIFTSMIYKEITCLCLNKEIAIEDIIYTNMKSLKCIECKGLNCYFCILKMNLISYDKEFDGFLIHPMAVFLNILEKIINNGNFNFDEKSLVTLLDPIQNEEMRSFLFMANQMEININVLFEI